MKKIGKNNYGVSSPLEFSIASMALIATIVIVTASMSPPIEQQNAQLQADASQKANEIMNLLLTPESDVGLAIDPGTSVPVPPSQSITEVTIDNIRPEISVPYPPDHGTVAGSVELSVNIEDYDEDSMNVSFTGFDNNDPENPVQIFYDDEHKELPDSRVTSKPWGLSDGSHYIWVVNVTDGKENASATYLFSTKENSPPDQPTFCCPSQDGYASGTPGECPGIGCTDDPYIFGAIAKDQDGGQIYYKFDWEDGTDTGWLGPVEQDVEFPGVIWDEADTTHIWNAPNTYTITVTVKDVPWGEESPSNTMDIIIGVCPEGLCFLGGTQILMADGSQKNIEDIQIGDIVKSYDERTDIISTDKIVNVFHDKPDQMVDDHYLLINNDLGVTPDHSLYINNEWIQARDLKIGDTFLQGKVTLIEKIFERVPTYNLETAKYHTYLVKFGNNIVIAHNARNYSFGGYEEVISISRQTSVTPEDFAALLSMDKIYELSEMSYEDLKEMLTIPNYYDFYIVIRNKDTVFMSYMPDKPIEKMQASIIQPTSENVIIVDSVGYAYATITVTVLR